MAMALACWAPTAGWLLPVVRYLLEPLLYLDQAFMDFKERLERAIHRGHAAGDAEARARAEQATSEEECRRLHTQYRLELSDHIEQCVRALPQHFPGFRYESIVGDRGWGAAINRDDFTLSGGRRANVFSRLEVAVRPYTSSHVLEITAKGTVRNKEIFNRSQFQMLTAVDLASFNDQIDRWVLEYAELYAAQG